MHYIAHIHIAGAPNRTNPAFENNIDYRIVINAIKRTGYNGFWGHKFVVTSDTWEELATLKKYLFDFGSREFVGVLQGFGPTKNFSGCCAFCKK